MRAKEKVNILMVDDQPGKLLTYETILAELDENLIPARCGSEALELLLKNDVAVVLTDVSMPGMDGFELADTIRQHPRFQQMPIIFISAVCVSDFDRLRGYQTGAVDYISVPIIPELLRAKVSVFAELHRRALQLETLNRELRHLSNSLIAAQDQERRRIARALHDGLGQELSAAKMVLDGLLSPGEASDPRKTVAAADASSMIERALTQVRSISHLLHPPLLDEVGLPSALGWFLKGFTQRSGIATTFNLEPAQLPRFSRELETAVFRIIQEALNNVFRHSGARSSWVDLQHQNGRLVIIVRDNGKGINTNVLEFRPDTIGIGMAGMRQRVKEFGGEIRLENCHPGTLVEINIPTANCLCQEENTKEERTKMVKDDLAVAAALALPISTQLPTPPSTPDAQHTSLSDSLSLSAAVSNDSVQSSLAATLPV